jgi:hypothetical protein
MQLATDSTALDAFTSAAGALETVQPTGSSAIAAAKSLIDKLPGPASSFYNSVLNADISIASSIVNNGVAATGSSAKGTAASATASGSGAAPTSAAVKAGGVAIAILGAAVAML